MMARPHTLLAVSLAALSSSQAVAQVPTAIPYVGEVTVSGSGAAYNGSVDVVVALYDSPSGGAPVWGPHPLGALDVEGGALYFVLGGDDTPAVDAAVLQGEVWLQLQLDGTVLWPRQQALSVPFARLAADAERLGGLDAAAYAKVSALSAVATSGSAGDLVDGAELARVSDLSDLAFTGDVADLVGNPAASILGPVFVKRAGDTLLGNLDFDLRQALRLRLQAVGAPPAPCNASNIGLIYFDMGLDELRVCGAAGWKSGGGGGGGSAPTQFAPQQSPFTVNQTAIPGQCAPVPFRNFATTAASGFGPPQVTGNYTTSGCPVSTCTGVLAAGATCTVHVRGTALASGPLTGTVSVAATTGGTAVAVVLGSAVLGSGPQLAALNNPLTVDQNGYVGACAEVTFTNVGTLPATGFSAPVFTGNYTTDGCTSGNCTGALAPAASCWVWVRGAASVSGPISGSLSVSATAGGTAVVALSGNATVGAGVRLAAAHAGSPNVSIYDANTDPMPKTSNPDVVPASTGNDVAYSVDGSRLAVAHAGSPFVTIYNATTMPYTKIANPVTLPASTANGVAFSQNGTRLAVGHAVSPFVTIYDTTTTPPAKLANPGVLPPDLARGVSFSPDGIRLAVAHVGAPCVTVYQTTVVPYAKIDNLSGLTDANCFDVAYSPDGKILAVGHSASPFVSLFNTATIPHQKLSAPAMGTLPSAAALGVSWSADGRYLAVAHNASPQLIVYDTSTQPYTRLPNPTTLPGGSGRAVAYSPNGKWFAVANTASPFLTIYDTATIPYTKVIGPNVLPPSVAYGVSFGPY